MAYSTLYGGLIWTDHALQRLHQRKCTQEFALQAFTSPDQVIKGRRRGTQELRKQVGSYTVTLIVSQNDERDWIVVSGWVDPPFPGSFDLVKKERYKRYQRAGFWGKAGMLFLKYAFKYEF